MIALSPNARYMISFANIKPDDSSIAGYTIESEYA